MDSVQHSARFAELYLSFVDLTRDEGRLAAEAADVDAALAAHDCRDILVVTCGTGAHSVELARLGYEVTGLDPSPLAVEQAGRRRDRAGVDAAFRVALPFGGPGWPARRFDAVVCAPAVHLANAGEWSRLLRAVRRCLAPGGLLLLRDPNPPWLAHDDPIRTVSGHGVRYTLEPRIDPVEGVLERCITATYPGGSEEVVRARTCLQSPRELARTARRAGFSVQRLGGTFLGKELDPRIAGVHLVGLASDPLPSSLAVASWNAPTDGPLDLRYAPDEADYLDPRPDSVWREVVEALGGDGASAISHYPVHDPYGSIRGAPVLSSCFQTRLTPDQVTFGPGVTSLLRDLAGLGEDGAVVTDTRAHPDLPAWAASRGCEVITTEVGDSISDVVATVRNARAAILHLDRPFLWGALLSLEAVSTLAARVSDSGTVVVVDESPATYLGPAASAVALVDSLDNLVVLRGHTKAYSWGGARVAYAVTSQGLEKRVRSLVCPLQVNELAFRAALRLLEHGDVFGRLRHRIRAVKPLTAHLFALAGFEVDDPHPALPWLRVPDPGGASSTRLASLGIHGLRCPPLPGQAGAGPVLLLLFSPLADERLEALRQRLGIQHAVPAATDPVSISGATGGAPP